MSAPTPDHIRLIAVVHCIASALAVWYFWPDTDLPELPDLTLLTVSMGLSLLPAMAGFFLLRGKRWVRWLLLALLPLVAAMAFIAMLGNAMRTAPGDPSEPKWLGIYFAVTLASTIAVFAYFARTTAVASPEEAGGP